MIVKKSLIIHFYMILYICFDLISWWYTPKKHGGQKEFLHSHDVQFTVGDKSFQEVVCHSERIGGNDEVSIILII